MTKVVMLWGEEWNEIGKPNWLYLFHFAFFFFSHSALHFVVVSCIYFAFIRHNTKYENNGTTTAWNVWLTLKIIVQRLTDDSGWVCARGEEEAVIFFLLSKEFKHANNTARKWNILFEKRLESHDNSLIICAPFVCRHSNAMEWFNECWWQILRTLIRGDLLMSVKTIECMMLNWCVVSRVVVKSIFDFHTQGNLIWSQSQSTHTIHNSRNASASYLGFILLIHIHQ